MGIIGIQAVILAVYFGDPYGFAPNELYSAAMVAVNPFGTVVCYCRASWYAMHSPRRWPSVMRYMMYY